MIRPLILLLLFLIAPSSVTAEGGMAQVAVSPERFEIEYDGISRTHALKLFNMSDRNLSVTVEASDWTLTKGKIEELPPTVQSLSQWLVFAPSQFDVSAKKVQVVRFAIRPRVKPSAGEHRAMIWLNEIPKKTAPKSGMQARFRFGIAVYLFVPPSNADAAIKKVRLQTQGKPTVALEITNTGNRHDRLIGTLSAWRHDSRLSDVQKSAILDRPGNEKPKHPDLFFVMGLSSMPVLADKTVRQKYVLPPLAPGDYDLLIKGKFSEGDDFAIRKNLHVPALAR